MKSDVIFISNDGSNMEAGLDQVEKVSRYKELSEKNAMHLRLLAEEMMAMMRAITGRLDGEFWVEDQNDVYELHLRVNSLTDEKQREQLLSASTSGKNEATRGFMGKIRSFFEPVNGTSLFTAGFASGTWSLETYRAQLLQYSVQEQDDQKEAWDELEKSVVAKIADDVKISIRERVVEMTIFKKLV